MSKRKGVIKVEVNVRDGVPALRVWNSNGRHVTFRSFKGQPEESVKDLTLRGLAATEAVVVAES